MGHAALLAVVAATTIGAWALARRSGAGGRARLRTAVGAMLDHVGLAAMFLMANLALGTAGILAVRAATGLFVSVYVIDDSVVIVLSFLQAVLFGPLLLRRSPVDDDTPAS